MILRCTHCEDETDCKIHRESSDVYCSECHKVVEVSLFFKNALLQQKDYYAGPLGANLTSDAMAERFGTKSFLFVCMQCRTKQPGVVLSDTKVVCMICDSPLDVSQSMLQALASSNRFHMKYSGRLKAIARSEPAPEKKDPPIKPIVREAPPKPKVMQSVLPKPKLPTSNVLLAGQKKPKLL